MAQENARGLLLVTQNDALVTELAWTLKRAHIEDEIERIATPGDARDALTARVRSGSLPIVLAVDVRTHPVAGSQLVKWVADTPRLRQMLVIAFMSRGTAADVMHLLGADVVFDSCPDAAKLAQLYRIAQQLAAIPPLDEPRPAVSTKPLPTRTRGRRPKRR